MKYFIPYGNNDDHDPILFKNEIEKRLPYICGIYCKIPFNEFDKKDSEYKEKVDRIFNFLSSIKDLPIEKFLLFNAHLSKTKRPHEEEIRDILKQLKFFEGLITGVTLVSLYHAKSIYQVYPNLKIDISVNTLNYMPQSLRFWKRHVPSLYSVNLPREYIRMEEKIDEYRKYGLKIKLLINEGCMFGCPFKINCGSPDGKQFCEYNGQLSTLLKSNWVSPKRLSELKEKIDIAKIAHRAKSIVDIFKFLDNYISESDECDIFDILSSHQRENFISPFREKRIPPIKINVAKIPKKIYKCECKECGEKCQVCEKFIKKCLINNYKNNNITKIELEYFNGKI